MKHIKLFENFSNPLLEKKKAKKGLPPWLAKKGKKKEDCDPKEEDCDDKPAKKGAKGKPAKKQSAKQAAFFKKVGWGKK